MNWNITSTGTVLAAPQQLENGLSMAVVATKLTQNMSGELVKSHLLFNITYNGRRVEELAPRLVKGTRVAFEGVFVGNQYGGPTIYETKDGKPYTNFQVVAGDLRITGQPLKKAKDDDEIFEDMTTVVLIGNLGKDAEMRFTPTGDMITSTSLAVNRTFQDANGAYQKATTWWRINIWRDRAEKANDLWKKGSKLVVKLTLRADEQTGAPPIWMRNDGQPSASYEGTVNTWSFASSKSQGDGGAPLPPEEKSVEEEELPF
jgi:single-strand DNA-binding protein